MQKIPKYDIKIVIGDANAKIGKEQRYQHLIRKESKHEETNENGENLIEFAQENRMIVKNTVFARKEIHKGTWISPDGKTINQIDHVLIDNRNAQVVTNIRS